MGFTMNSRIKLANATLSGRDGFLYIQGAERTVDGYWISSKTVHRAAQTQTIEIGEAVLAGFSDNEFDVPPPLDHDLVGQALRDATCYQTQRALVKDCKAVDLELNEASDILRISPMHRRRGAYWVDDDKLDILLKANASHVEIGEAVRRAFERAT
jgi:CDI immunity protein